MGTTSQPPGNEKANIRFLKPDQVEAMRDAAYQGRHGQRDAIVTLLYDTGLRRSELAAVDRDMLDLDDAQLRLPGHIQKDYPNEGSPQPVTIELDPEGELRTVRTVRSFLGTRGDDSPALFPSRKSDRMTTTAIPSTTSGTVSGTPGWRRPNRNTTTSTASDHRN